MKEIVEETAVLSLDDVLKNSKLLECDESLTGSQLAITLKTKSSVSVFKLYVSNSKKSRNIIGQCVAFLNNLTILQLSKSNYSLSFANSNNVLTVIQSFMEYEQKFIYKY